MTPDVWKLVQVLEELTILSNLIPEEHTRVHLRLLLIQALNLLKQEVGLTPIRFSPELKQHMLGDIHCYIKLVLEKCPTLRKELAQFELVTQTGNWTSLFEA